MSSAMQFYLTTLLVYFGVDLIAVWGLNLQFGVAGIVNFAFILLQAAGAYTAAVLSLGPDSGNGGFQHYVGGAHIPFPLPIVGAALVGAVISAVVGLIVMRRLRGDYAAIVLLVVSLIGTTVAENQSGLLNGPTGLSVIPQPLQSILGLSVLGYSWFYVALTFGFCLLALWAASRISHSPLGRGMRAARDNEASAEAVGLNVPRLRMTAFIAGGVLAAVSGALLAEYIGTWAPSAWLYPETLVYFTAVIVGGRANLLGVAVGSLLVNIIIQELPRFLPQIGGAGVIDALQWVVIGGFLIVFLWVRPRGIFPERARRFDVATPAAQQPGKSAVSADPRKGG